MILKMLMEPSAKIKDPNERANAELLTALLICRMIAVVIFCAILIHVKSPAGEALYGACAINVIAYFLARTKWFRLGLYIAILDPLIGIPLAAATHSDNLNIATGGGLFLAVGTVMASLLLPLRHNVAIICFTTLAFGFLVFKVEPVYRILTISELITVLVISCLALLSSHLREKSDRALEVERAKVLQSSKLASLGEMASGVAHELNSPLAAIVLTGDVLEDILSGIKTDDQEALNDAVNEVKAISSIAERMGKIIKGLKTFARDGHNEPLQPTTALSWVNESLELCEQRFKNAGVKVEVKPKNLDTICTVQTIQISQTLINLFNNAFDAIKDKQNKWIMIDAVKANGFLELRITDSGSGISKDNLEKIFQPFYTTKDFGHGTGLGLSISKGIAQHHGGDLVYDSSSPNTRFVLRLPIAGTAAMPATSVSSEEKIAA